MSHIYEKILRRILKESHRDDNPGEYAHVMQTRGQALIARRESGAITAVIYDQNRLIDNIEALGRDVFTESNETVLQFLLDGIFLGIIQIKKPQSPCNGAWEVSASVGPSKLLARNVYGLAYALSPSGSIIADRSSVSGDALNAWRSIYSSKSSPEGGKKTPSGRVIRGRKRLDDLGHQHDIEGNEYHTDDPADDCKIYKDEAALNWSYEAEGWEYGMLQFLERNHELTMKDLSKFSSSFSFNFDEAIFTFMLDFWKKHYSGAALRNY